MTRIGRIAFSGVFIALLLGCQFALAGVVGVEVVTPLLLSFCFYFGVRQGMVVGTAFSFVRCFVFGFSPTAIVLYLIYYNLFALVFGMLGHWRGQRVKVATIALLAACAVGMTTLFTLLDDVITPLFYGFTLSQLRVYFIASLTALVPQCISSAVTVPILVPPLLRAYTHLPKPREREL